MNRKLLTMAVAGLLSVAGLSAQEPQLVWGLRFPRQLKHRQTDMCFL